jgi:hypothetical protein
MRIKIIKASEDIYWYNKHIGREFDVNDESDEYIVLDNRQVNGNEDEGIFYTIDKNDCEVLPIEMVKEKSWKEFRDFGLLWWINTILHMFGWAIVYNFNDNEEIVDVYPARVKFRGFQEKNVTEGYQKVSKYLQENIDDLVKESME